MVRTPHKSVEALIEPARRGNQNGFWVDMGAPWFGPDAVEAVASELTARAENSGEAWTVHRLRTPLTVIACAPADAADRERGRSFRRGINLQWARVNDATAPGGEGRVAARIFERGEGPTRSSGSSATAVACAAWHLGLLRSRSILVATPGGEAPIELDVDAAGQISRARLFGVAKRL
jgi:diaminopimelate epimerase